MIKFKQRNQQLKIMSYIMQVLLELKTHNYLDFKVRLMTRIMKREVIEEAEEEEVVEGAVEVAEDSEIMKAKEEVEEERRKLDI